MTALRMVVLTAAIAVLGGWPVAGDAAGSQVEVRGDDGKPLITANQIHKYEWATHTLTLAPKVRERLTGQLVQSRKLAVGVPFTITVDGKPIYRGNFTSTFSSKSLATPVIILHLPNLEPELGPDQLRIQLGYPTPQFFRGTDPRPDARLRKALGRAGKLIAPQFDADP